MRKLVACLACRNQGTRLYGKPLQNLDIDNGLTILDYIIEGLKLSPPISSIVLGISEGVENEVFKEVAKKHNISFIIGDQTDVLSRLIQCCKKEGGTDIFRMTTESPFNCYDLVPFAWNQHIENRNDFTTLDNVPDGAGMEIIALSAYIKSWENGNASHRSELCSLYIRQNKSKFRIGYIEAPKNICRTDIRLTVDYPEDLVICRKIYSNFKHYAPQIPLIEIIEFLDNHPEYKKLVEPFIANGMKSMYL